MAEPRIKAFNYAALFPELFTNDSSRAKANAMRQAFQLVVDDYQHRPDAHGDAGPLGHGPTSVLYGVLGGGLILSMTFTFREPGHSTHKDLPGLWQSIQDLVSDWKLWVASLANAWQRYTTIEKSRAAGYGLVVVMPTAGRSFYLDQPNGNRRLNLGETATTMRTN